MNCIIYINTKTAVSDFNEVLSNFLGINNQVHYIYAQTSLSSNASLLSQYFYGNANHTINYLIASEGANTIRLFIEGINKKDNLDQLITGTQLLFSNILSFLKSNKIKYSNITATIWSEDEQVLVGEYHNYFKKYFSNLPDIPTSIYLSVVTVFYSLWQVNYDANSHNVFEESIKTALINLLLICVAVVIWMFIKTFFKDKNLSFKIK